MAIAKITGSMLQTNLLRHGIDFAVETDLLYFDVGNSRVGIKTTGPSQALEVVGGTTIDNISITGNVISTVNTDGDITLTPDGTGTIIVSGQLATSASTTTRAGFNIPTGTAPSSPAQGDIWVVAGDAFIRINGVTESIIGAGGGGGNLGDLSDVTFTAEVDGEIVRFNGSDWINNTLSEAGIPRMTVAAGAPSSPSEGDYWLNSNTQEISIYANAIWEPIIYKTEIASDTGELNVNGGFF